MVMKRVFQIEFQYHLTSFWFLAWTKMMDSLRKLGKVGDIVAKILDHYKDQLVKIVKKIASTGLGGLEKIVADIRDDIIKIIQGGHITYSDLEEMTFSIMDPWVIAYVH